MTAPDTRSRHRYWQRRVFAIAWLSYASFYLCRVNISVALPAIGEDFGWSMGRLGLIGTAFLWLYAAGQLVNGTLGQRADARWFVGTGMLVSAACCAAFGSADWLWVMIPIWGLNGWAQSMGWGPIVKTIAAWFSSQRRGRMTAFFAPCFVLGHLVAWVAGGWIVQHWGWRQAFWMPAMVFAGMAVVWLVGIRSTPEAAGFDPPQGADERGRPTLGDIFLSLWTDSRVRWGALTCVFASMIKDGLVFWAPFLLVDSLGMTFAQAARAAAIMPLLGLSGSLLAGWLIDRVFHSREAPVIVVFSLAVGLLMPAFMLAHEHGSAMAMIALLGVCGMCVHGISVVLLAALPLSFGRTGNVAAVAGFLDFAAYTGGGISALLVGQLVDWSGWNAVFAYWFIATLAAIGGGVMLGRRVATQTAARDQSSRAGGD